MATILLVEDDTLNREMVTRRLVWEGYQIISAEDGAAGASASVRNDNRLARSLGTIERVTGVSGRPTTATSEVEELARLQREKEIQERLAQYKGHRN